MQDRLKMQNRMKMQDNVEIPREMTTENRPEISSEIERYEFLSKLGEGGNGSVYLVRDVHLDRQLAMKIVESAELHFFHKEVEILKKTEWKLLPTIYDAWIMQDGTGIIIMEYIHGEDLYSYLEKHSAISEEQFHRWAISLTEFLCQIHDSTPPVLYRDLKPENIMVKRDGSLSMIDFGTVVCMEQEWYQDGKRIGTKGFAAPEQWMGKWIDRRSDIYSLGMVLRILSEHCIYHSGELEKIIKKCTQERPERRYMTAHGLLQDLQNYRKNEKRKLIRERAVYMGKVLVLILAGYSLFSNRITIGLFHVVLYFMFNLISFFTCQINIPIKNHQKYKKI